MLMRVVPVDVSNIFRDCFQESIAAKCLALCRFAKRIATFWEDSPHDRNISVIFSFCTHVDFEIQDSSGYIYRIEHFELIQFRKTVFGFSRIAL